MKKLLLTTGIGLSVFSPVKADVTLQDSSGAEIAFNAAGEITNNGHDLFNIANVTRVIISGDNKSRRPIEHIEAMMNPIEKNPETALRTANSTIDFVISDLKAGWTKAENNFISELQQICASWAHINSIEISNTSADVLRNFRYGDLISAKISWIQSPPKIIFKNIDTSTVANQSWFDWGKSWVYNPYWYGTPLDLSAFLGEDMRADVTVETTSDFKKITGIYFGRKDHNAIKSLTVKGQVHMCDLYTDTTQYVCCMYHGGLISSFRIPEGMEQLNYLSNIGEGLFNGYKGYSSLMLFTEKADKNFKLQLTDKTSSLYLIVPKGKIEEAQNNGNDASKICNFITKDQAKILGQMTIPVDDGWMNYLSKLGGGKRKNSYGIADMGSCFCIVTDDSNSIFFKQATDTVLKYIPQSLKNESSPIYGINANGNLYSKGTDNDHANRKELADNISEKSNDNSRTDLINSLNTSFTAIPNPDRPKNWTELEEEEMEGQRNDLKPTYIIPEDLIRRYDPIQPRKQMQQNDINSF